MTQYGYEPGGVEVGTPLFDVTLCSGETLRVQTAVEQRWFNDTKAKYLAETRFTDMTDMQDMDRLLCLELLMFRWNQHLASGYDYQNELVDDDLLRKQVKEQSVAITALKSSLSLDKKSRDAALNEGNFAAWFADVKRRAKLFGIHRETQLNTALALMNELAAIVGAFDRSDNEERKKLGFENEGEILKWVRESMIPDFQKIDEYFTEHEQKLWRRDL